MIVVSDSSPLIALSAMGYLELARQLYDSVLIPQAVFDEITADAAARTGAREIAAASWIEVRTVSNRSVLAELADELDAGESEAIALALEVHAELLLVDERKARRVALHYGLEVTGVGGLLIEAKRKGLIPLVKPLLDDLEARIAFRMKPSFYDAVLRAAGE